MKGTLILKEKKAAMVTVMMMMMTRKRKMEQKQEGKVWITFSHHSLYWIYVLYSHIVTSLLPLLLYIGVQVEPYPKLYSFLVCCATHKVINALVVLLPIEGLKTSKPQGFSIKFLRFFSIVATSMKNSLNSHCTIWMSPLGTS